MFVLGKRLIGSGDVPFIPGGWRIPLQVSGQPRGAGWAGAAARSPGYVVGSRRQATLRRDLAAAAAGWSGLRRPPLTPPACASFSAS